MERRNGYREAVAKLTVEETTLKDFVAVMKRSFVAAKRVENCFACGKPGHFAREYQKLKICIKTEDTTKLLEKEVFPPVTFVKGIEKQVILRNVLLIDKSVFFYFLALSLTINMNQFIRFLFEL